MQHSYESHLAPVYISDSDKPYTDRSSDSNLFRPTSFNKWTTSALAQHEEELREQIEQMKEMVGAHAGYGAGDNSDDSEDSEESSSTHPHKGKALTLHVEDMDSNVTTPVGNHSSRHDEDDEKDESTESASDEEPPGVKTAIDGWKVGDSCVLQRMPREEYENAHGRLLEYLPQKRKWRVLLVMGKTKIVVIVPKSNLKHAGDFPKHVEDGSLSRSNQSSVTVTPRKTPKHVTIAAQQPPEVSDTEFNQLLHLLHELKDDVAKMKKTSKEKRAPKSSKKKDKREQKSKAKRRRGASRHREKESKKQHRHRSRHRKKPRKKRRLPEEQPFYGGGPLPPYPGAMGLPPIPPPHMAAPPMYGGPPAYSDPYMYPTNAPAAMPVDPYYFPQPQMPPMQYSTAPPPAPLVQAPPPPQMVYPTGPQPYATTNEPIYSAPQYRPPQIHRLPQQISIPTQNHYQPPLPQQQHFQEPLPPRRGHSEARHTKQRVPPKHKRANTHAGTPFDRLEVKDNNKEYRTRSHDPTPRRKKSRTPDYYETLKGDKSEGLPRTRTKPKVNNSHFVDMEPHEQKRKVEFQEHPPVPHYYEDRQSHANSHANDMHHIMQQSALSDMNNAHTHSVPQAHSSDVQHTHAHPHHDTHTHETHHAHHGVPLETSHHVQRETSHHIQRETSHHIQREMSHHAAHVAHDAIYQPTQPQRQVSHQPSNQIHYYQHNEQLPDQEPDYKTARVSKRYFVEDDHFIDRKETIEQEKYHVSGVSSAEDPYVPRQVSRYASYASSNNPYLGTLPDERYVQKAGHAIE